MKAARQQQLLAAAHLFVLACSASLTVAPGVEIAEVGGDYAGKASRDMAAGDVVFAADLAGTLSADAAVRRVLARAAGLGQQELWVAAMREELEPVPLTGAEETGAGFAPALELEDEARAAFCLAYELSRVRAEWSKDGPPGGGLQAALLPDSEAEQLLGAFKAERDHIRGQVAAWVAVLRRVGAEYDEDDLAWAAVLTRTKGLPGPEGDVLAPFSPLFRQMHPGCKEVVVHLNEGQGAQPAQLVGILTTPSHGGDELCVRYAEGPISQQQLLIQHGIQTDDLLSEVGVHYYITDSGDGTAGPVLEESGCVVGELLLVGSGLTDRDFRCFLLHQLPEAVRADYEELFRPKQAVCDGLAAMGQFLGEVLSEYYSVQPSEILAFTEDSLPPPNNQAENPASGGESMPADEHMPYVVKQAMLHNTAHVAQPTATPGSEEGEGEVGEADEGDEEDVVNAEPSDRVRLLNGKLARAVDALAGYQRALHGRWAAMVRSRRDAEQDKLRAETERLREQVRRAREDFELSNLDEA